MKLASVIPVNPQRSSPSKIQQVGQDERLLKPLSVYGREIKAHLPGVSVGVPSPPVELHVTGASRDFLSIAWKPPLRDGGCPITGYHIEMCEAGTEKWMRVNSRPVKELKYRVEEGVVPEKEYILRVRAINSAGVSEPSDISENVFAKESDCEFG